MCTEKFGSVLGEVLEIPLESPSVKIIFAALHGSVFGRGERPGGEVTGKERGAIDETLRSTRPADLERHGEELRERGRELPHADV